MGINKNCGDAASPKYNASQVVFYERDPVENVAIYLERSEEREGVQVIYKTYKPHAAHIWLPAFATLIHEGTECTCI